MKKILPVLLSLFLILGFASHSIAAAVGDVLNEPEEGWNRYNYDAPEIDYSDGEWFLDKSGPLTWSSPWQVYGTGFKFNFVGTKIRLISTTWWSGSSNIDVIIDGVKADTISLNGSNVTAKNIMFEKTGLSNGEHSIEFINNTPNYLFVYAVDVDGELKPYQPIDPTPVEPEPEPNPEPKPEPEQPKGDRAILVVTMTTGLEKEYDLSMDEVNAFINWYDAKDAGSGPSKYAIDKHNNNKGPFSKRTDYVIFNNILTFEVNEYTVK